MMTLAEQLNQLDAELSERLQRHHFDPVRFERLAAPVRSGQPASNRVSGQVTRLADGDLATLPAPGDEHHDRLEQAGLDLLSQGQCALVLLAGGMATRMGSVIKSLVPALSGRTFLDLRLAEMRAVERRAGQRAPLWLMTSHATDGGIRRALGSLVDQNLVGVFAQHLSLRLTPQGDLFVDNDGRPSEHAPGHGDLPDALRASGLLQRFIGRGGRVVALANIDNLGATLDPAVLGWHLKHGQPVTCEVVDKVGSDRGGIPVRLDRRPVVLEEFRLPQSFDPTTVPVFNTNTFCFDARALLDLQMDWTYFRVTKQVGGKPAIQFERLVGEVTSHLETRFLRVPRDGVDSRFLPVKDPQEHQRRQAQLAEVCVARGMLT
jgi:UTP--glucose-1-phosphate uridylyltransferase